VWNYHYDNHCPTLPATTRCPQRAPPPASPTTSPRIP